MAWKTNAWLNGQYVTFLKYLLYYNGQSEVQFKSRGATCEVAKQTVHQAAVMDGETQKVISVTKAMVERCSGGAAIIL